MSRLSSLQKPIKRQINKVSMFAKRCTYVTLITLLTNASFNTLRFSHISLETVASLSCDDFFFMSSCFFCSLFVYWQFALRIWLLLWLWWTFIYNIVYQIKRYFNLRASKNKQRCFNNFRKTWISLRLKNIIQSCVKTVNTCKYFQRSINLVIRDLLSKINIIRR